MTGALERQIAAIICTEKNTITVRYVIIIARSIIMHNFITVGSDNVKNKEGLRIVACLLYLLQQHLLQVNIRVLSCSIKENEGASSHILVKINNEWSMFSTTRSEGRENKSRVKVVKEIELFCDCRTVPASFADMVECSQCQRWYHTCNYEDNYVL